MKAAEGTVNKDDLLLRGLLRLSELSGLQPLDLVAIETTALETLAGALELQTLLYFRASGSQGVLRMTRHQGVLDGCEALFREQFPLLEGKLVEHAMQSRLPHIWESPCHVHTRGYLPWWLAPLQPGGVFLLPLVDDERAHGLMLGWSGPTTTISYTPNAYLRFLALQQLLILCLRK